MQLAELFILQDDTTINTTELIQTFSVIFSEIAFKGWKGQLFVPKYFLARGFEIHPAGIFQLQKISFDN
jgi:hypothetical protein